MPIAQISDLATLTKQRSSHQYSAICIHGFKLLLYWLSFRDFLAFAGQRIGCFVHIVSEEIQINVEGVGWALGEGEEGVCDARTLHAFGWRGVGLS